MQSKTLVAFQRALAELEPGARVVLAVSGGLDSMVLLAAAARTPGPEYHVAHVDHGLREDSASDARFVEHAARKLGFPFHLQRLENVRGQNACRQARRRFLLGLVPRPIDRILSAHHLDDQAETLLLRLMRGTGLRGLAGIRPRNGRFLRPFLALEKRELLATAKSWRLRWREDSSNAAPKYERNWIRLELLPLLESRRPGLSRRLAALAEEAESLRQPLGRADSFRLGSSVLYRGLESDPAALSARFGLDRRHALRLASLLDGGSGELTSPVGHFQFSAGILLMQKVKRPIPPIVVENGGARSALGRWPDAARSGAGDSWKKRCQEAGIPVFLRAAIASDGKRLRYPAELSPLGAWLFIPSGANDSPASTSKAGILRPKQRRDPPRPRV